MSCPGWQTLHLMPAPEIAFAAMMLLPAVNFWSGAAGRIL